MNACHERHVMVSGNDGFGFLLSHVNEEEFGFLLSQVNEEELDVVLLFPLKLHMID
jgi:hypothetical protein